MVDRFKDKVVLITGAGSGIGCATAKLFSKEGATVCVADINEEAGQSVSNEIVKSNGNAFFNYLDVTDEKLWKNTIKNIEKKYNQLNILVNNAGISIGKLIKDTTLENWRKITSVNLDGVFLGTKYSMELMQNTPGGSIINISSAYGIVGNPGSAAYCASKGGVILFSKASALEFAKLPNPIRVNSVCPGVVETPIWGGDWWSEFIKKMGGEEAAWKALSKKSALGHNAKTEEIAKGILFLASDDSSYMTGTELVIDGGCTAK